jgi:hypothetical protein
VYVIPTSKGIATAVCVDPPTPSAAPAFAATCERAVGTLTTTGSIVRFGANATYAHALSSTISTLNRQRASLGKKLSSAKTPAAQATAAARLTRAYNKAAAAAGKLNPGPVAGADHKTIVAALKRTANAYSALATAASKHRGSAYNAARHDVSVDQAALTRALANLRAAGYTVS